MKKLLSLTIIIILAAATLMTGCDATQKDEPSPVKFTVGFVVADSTVDSDPFNESVWKGIIDYGETNGISHKYFTSEEDDTEGYLAAVKEAVDSDVKVIVMSGKKMQRILYKAQKTYPKIDFIYIAGEQGTEKQIGSQKLANNTLKITFAHEQAGYLAGYAAVKDDHWDLGFMGSGASAAVKDYGYGFVQGAEAAADEMGVTDLNIKYHYVKQNGKAEDIQNVQDTARSWYEAGTEVIFACGDDLLEPVTDAADEEGCLVIGADVNRSGFSGTVMTSAANDYTAAVKFGLQKHFDGNFQGGKVYLLDASKNGVMLPMEESKFSGFSDGSYDKLYDRLSGGSVKVLNSSDVSLGDLDLQIVKLEII